MVYDVQPREYARTVASFGNRSDALSRAGFAGLGLWQLTGQRPMPGSGEPARLVGDLKMPRPTRSN